MKSRNFVIKYIFGLMVVFIGLAAVYTFVNRDKIFLDRDKKEEHGSQEVVNKKKDENLSPNNSKNEDISKPSVPAYSSPNESTTPGVKVVATYEEFIGLINRDSNTFLVLGREGCHYCELYKPVLEEVAQLYKIEIVYVDMAKLSNEDYSNVMHAPLTIPAKCSKSSEEVELSKGFGTPLSLFIKSNQTYDCIRGYKDKDNLISSLKVIKYID